MTENETFVIVGGGLAGARAAEAIRGEGFSGKVAIVADEDAFPYIRPPLSKEYLQGGADRDSVVLNPADWYAPQDIEVLRGEEASALSLGSHELTLASGQVLRYDKLLLATGAAPRRFGGPGADLPGVYYLRTLADSSALRAALSPGNRRVVVVGSGWIGLEVAATARGYGNTVTVLGHEPVPLAAAVGERVGHVFAGLHREHGVDLRSSTDVEAILGDARGVTGVQTASGDVVPADVVVLGIGVIPNTGLAQAAGLAVDNGIVTDASFRTTDADVYAVGDVASVYHPVLERRIRIEHWANAENAGAAAGRVMAGAAVEYDEIPYFYTDQYDLGMEYSGYGVLAADAEVVFRGDVEGREFIAFWVTDSRVVAGMNVNVWDVNETVQKLIRDRVPVDAARLQDESIALENLLSTVGADEGN
jgi:3-phenylpropionate/trans-cinnamate dioxygenase ferredoxin reductase subunit